MVRVLALFPYRFTNRMYKRLVSFTHREEFEVEVDDFLEEAAA